MITSNSLHDPVGHITTRSYRSGGEEKVTTDDLGEISDLLAESGCEIVWVDIDDPTKDDLVELAAELGLHHLAVEDALDSHQRDKYVHYDRHVFLVAHDVSLDVDLAELRITELDVFVGDRWMVTVHRGAEPLIERIHARWDKARRFAVTSIGVAVYSMLDVVVDGYFDTIDRFEEFYDDAADQIFGERPIEPTAHRHWFEMRRALNQFDRIVSPLTDALTTVVDQDLDRFGRESAPYLRDAEGELSRAAAEVDSLRELVGHLVDSNLILRDYRQNQIVKQVTSWAAIIAVPTLVTGYYGMNVPYPGSGETWGVVAATGLALGISGGLYVLFKKRHWL